MSSTTTGGIKPKHQRLVLLVIALVALVGAGLLAAYALSNQASYFYVPSDLVKDRPEQGRAIRLGVMVEKGSLKTRPDGVTIDFIVGDGTHVNAGTFKSGPRLSKTFTTHLFG